MCLIMPLPASPLGNRKRYCHGPKLSQTMNALLGRRTPSVRACYGLSGRLYGLYPHSPVLLLNSGREVLSAAPNSARIGSLYLSVGLGDWRNGIAAAWPCTAAIPFYVGPPSGMTPANTRQAQAAQDG